MSSPLQFASWREKPNHGNIHVTMNALDALGNPTRREILNELRRAPMPVGALARRFAVSRPAISRHLRVLQNAGLVSPEDRGTQNVYAVRVQGFRAVREYIDSFWDVALSQLEELAR
ncbi:MAG: winged helix-turn-helix domain-containing protein [Candidatus Velthaea sp.]